MSWSKEEMKKAAAAIYEKAAKDAAFRQLCVMNPGEAVKQVTGKALPEGFNVQFIDKSASHLTFVLPDPLTDQSALSDQELDHVAGGTAVGNMNMGNPILTIEVITAAGECGIIPTIRTPFFPPK